MDLGMGGNLSIHPRDRFPIEQSEHPKNNQSRHARLGKECVFLSINETSYVQCSKKVFGVQTKLEIFLKKVIFFLTSSTTVEYLLLK